MTKIMHNTIAECIAFDREQAMTRTRRVHIYNLLFFIVTECRWMDESITGRASMCISSIMSTTWYAFQSLLFTGPPHPPATVKETAATTTSDKHLSVGLSPLLLICHRHSNRDFYRNKNYKLNINIGTAFVVLNLSSREIRDSKWNHMVVIAPWATRASGGHFW